MCQVVYYSHMGVNTYQKGNRNELAACKLLQDDGYLTERKNHAKFCSPDFFGMFDILAIKKNKTLLVQIKSNPSDFYKARKEIKQWIKTNKIKIPCEIWLKVNNKPWRKEIISSS